MSVWLRTSSGWIAAAALLASAAAGAADKQTFTGIITDDMCARADHSRMQMGPTDAECVTACIDLHGALYVLFDGEHAYTLSDQRAPEPFAGRRVSVVGVLDAAKHTIVVDSIRPAPAK